MIDYHIMDAIISEGPFFSINEDNLTVTVCIEGEDMIKFANDTNIVYFPRKVTSYPLGDNIFNFLSISSDDLRHVKHLAETADWDYYHSDDDENRFISSLDCIYLYLIFYSEKRKDLCSEYHTGLDKLSKEFEFALNFCCSDEYEPRFKNLTSLQRYYLYSQLYIENINTVDRYYIQNRHMFIEASRKPELGNIQKNSTGTHRYGLPVNEYDPMTKIPALTDSDISSIQNTQISLSFKFRCTSLSEYLMEELFSLIKLNVKVRKCKNCGKYFILKGDYATEYCDRIPDGENNTCKRLAAIKARKSKVKASPMLIEYQKAYKRNYARVSNGKITHDEFKGWVEEATLRRDKAMKKYEKQPSDKIVQDFKEYLGNK